LTEVPKGWAKSLHTLAPVGAAITAVKDGTVEFTKRVLILTLPPVSANLTVSLRMAVLRPRGDPPPFPFRQEHCLRRWHRLRLV